MSEDRRRGRGTGLNSPLHNAIVLQRAVTIPSTPAQVFDFLTTKVPAHYQALARGHDRFDVVGGAR
jgi:hypothetical protein